MVSTTAVMSPCREPKWWIQHPVAGTHGGGDVAQRAVGHALSGEVVNNGGQEVLTLHLA